MDYSYIFAGKEREKRKKERRLVFSCLSRVAEKPFIWWSGGGRKQ